MVRIALLATTVMPILIQRSIPIPLVLEHPSISNDGNKVLWLQHETSNHLARLKNISANTVQTVVSAAAGYKYPFLTGDGLFTTYGLKSNTVWAVFTKDLTTAAVQQGTSPASPKNHTGMVWMQPLLPGKLRVTITGLPTGQLANVTVTSATGAVRNVTATSTLNLASGISQSLDGQPVVAAGEQPIHLYLIHRFNKCCLKVQALRQSFMKN